MSYKVLRAISDLRLGIPVTVSEKNDSLCIFPVDFIKSTIFNVLQEIDGAKLLIPENRIDYIINTNFYSDVSINLQHFNYSIFKNLIQYYPRKELISIVEHMQDIDDLEYLTINLMKYSELFPMAIVCAKEKIFSKIEELFGIPCCQLSNVQMDDFYNYFIDEPDIKEVTRSRMIFENSEYSELIIYQEGLKQHIVVIFNKNALNDPLIRIHSSCYTGDILESLTCDCNSQLKKSINSLKKYKNGGILLYLSQEGRGIGIANKIRCYSIQQEKGFNTIDSNKLLGFDEDFRDFRVASVIMKDLNIKSVYMMTNNMRKIKIMEDNGIKIINRVSADFDINEHNINYLKTKKDRMGHILEV